jgi:hypothetical protein
MAIECFEIRWTKPYPLEKVTKQSDANEKGVYIRSKLSAGKMTPTYLGKSTDFRERSKTHEKYTAYSGADMSKQYITGSVPKPLGKIMSHNDPLVKLITTTNKPNRKSAASSWPF